MANRGREYAEELVGALDRSGYGQQRTVAQNAYNTNWENVQNQYKNLQDKLKLQQQKANRDFAEGLVDVAESSFNRQRSGSGNLANRGLSASGLTNILSQADTAQKGEDISRLLKNAGDISVGTADKLSQANAKYAQESTNLMGKLANTLADIGDAETAAQNRYNQTLAGIAESKDKRDAAAALQAAQRGNSKSSAQNELNEFYKRAAINEILASPEMSDLQKENYLKIMFGIDNAGQAVMAYNNNVNVTDNYNKITQLENENANARRTARDILGGYGTRIPNQVLVENLAKDIESKNNNEIQNLRNKGITYEDLAQILYGNR